LGSSNPSRSIALSFAPQAPAAAGSLARDIEGAAGAGEPLARVVEALAGESAAAAQAAGAIGLAGAAWETHRGERVAGDILAGDALLTRALELGTTLPDPACRRAYLTYITRAFSAHEGGARFLLGAAVEIGLALAGWGLEHEEDGPAAVLAEMVRRAGGPLIIPPEARQAPASVQAVWAHMLASGELRDWR
jgi:hypothetical protein